VTLEELRAFLTSVLLNPVRSRNWMSWVRSRTTDRLRKDTGAMAKNGAAPAASEAAK